MGTGDEDGVDVDPDGVQLSGGAGTVLIALIIGGAILATAFMVWDFRQRREEMAERARLEEKVREDLIRAYNLLRNNEPQVALRRTAVAQANLERIAGGGPDDYAELRAARRILEAEAHAMLGGRERLEAAETEFSRALNIMRYSSGEIWMLGTYSRGRTRYDLAQYAEAVADFDAVLNRNAGFGAAYYWRSLAKRHLGDRVGAAQDAERAKSLDSWPPHRDFLHAPDVSSTRWDRLVVFGDATQALGNSFATISLF